jgi:hypothetical protein
MRHDTERQASHRWLHCCACGTRLQVPAGQNARCCAGSYLQVARELVPGYVELVEQLELLKEGEPYCSEGLVASLPRHGKHVKLIPTVQLEGQRDRMSAG